MFRFEPSVNVLPFLNKKIMFGVIVLNWIGKQLPDQSLKILFDKFLFMF